MAHFGRSMSLRRPAICLALLAMLVGPLSAQIGGGSIVGTMTDPSGAAIAGVHVKAVNTGSNTSEETVTNQSGYYEFPLLAAGRYRLGATAKGFTKLNSSEFTLNSGTRPRIDLTLTVGQVDQSLDVVATAPVINTTTADLGIVVDRAKVDQLPLNGRNFQQLVGLQSGVINSPSSGIGARGGIEFNGASALANNLLLDGVDMSLGEINGSASDASAGSSGGLLINTISIEAIEEFKATGSSFAAEYGRSAGGVLNVTTKSGTNELHGTLFEFFRNDKLDANSFFNNRSGLVRPPLRWNQYGANLGGPILRNRLFFFVNYEGAQVRRASPIAGNTYTPALLQQVNPQIRQFLVSALPPPTESTSNSLIGFHRRNDVRTNSENTFLARGDLDLGVHRLFARFSYNHQDYTQPRLLPSLPTVFPLRFFNAAVQDSWSITPTLVNEFRVGFNRSDLFRNEPGRDNFPAWIDVPGASIVGSLGSYIRILPTTYTIADNLTKVAGKHSIKAGFEIRDVRSARSQDGQPTHYYNNVNDLIADNANRIQVLFGGGKGLRTQTHGYYVQDDWRILPNLQINAGIRYEYYSPFRGGFNISSSNPYGPFIRGGQAMFAADRNNWAPRLGLVWDPTGQQKWVIRAGAGIGYVPPQPVFAFDFAFIDPALAFVSNFAPSTVPQQFRPFPLPLSFVNSIKANPSLLPPNLFLARSVSDYNRKDTYAGQWNLAVQHAVTKDLSLQAAYVGSRTVNLNIARTLNLVDPALARRPNPAFGDVNVIENVGRISYHSLQLSANQRLSHGLSFDLYYTYANGMAYGPVDSTINFAESSVQDPNNLAGSYGPRQGNLRHRFVGVYSIEIPTGGLAKTGLRKAVLSGWTLQGILSMRSGLPINVASGVDFVGNGRPAGQRPDLIAGADPFASSSDGLRYLNAAAFDNQAPAAQRRFGNLGYNALTGPSGFTYDAALHKIFQIGERQSVAFRFEMFNALNHKVLNNPVATRSDPNFGLIQSASEGRNIQFALKYRF